MKSFLNSNEINCGLNFCKISFTKKVFQPNLEPFSHYLNKIHKILRLFYLPFLEQQTTVSFDLKFTLLKKLFNITSNLFSSI